MQHARLPQSHWQYHSLHLMHTRVGKAAAQVYDLAQSIGRYTQQRLREIQHDSAQSGCLPILLRPH